MRNFYVLFSGELQRLKRYNILGASLIVSLIWIGILYFVEIDNITDMVPLLLFIDATSMPMLLIGATMFYERQEEVIKTLLVSPIDKTQYILAKTFANIISSVITVVLIYAYAKLFKEINLSFLGLLGSICLIAFFHSLIGFILTYNTKDFTEMLMGMMKYVFIFTIPIILEWAGLITNKTIKRILYIIPTKSSLVLLNSTGGGIEPQEIWTSIIYLAMVSIALFYGVWKKFDDFAMKESGD